MPGKRKTLPRFQSTAEITDFFDTHDMGAYAHQLPSADLDIQIARKKHFVAIDEDIFAEVGTIAQSKKVSPEKLINSWLRERITHGR